MKHLNTAGVTVALDYATRVRVSYMLSTGSKPKLRKPANDPGFIVCSMKNMRPLLIFCVCLLTANCGSGLIKGQPPLVGMSSLQAQPSGIQTRIDVYNPNGVDMMVSELEMSMVLGEADLGSHRISPDLVVHPNGTEEIGFAFPAQDVAGQTLADLESGEINSVPYTIEGRVFDSDGDSEQFSQDGYLYPLPGRPGEFRGAGPQRDGSRR